MNKFSGYEVAQQIDDQINHLLGEHPITAENCLEWLNFSRTIETSLILISEDAKNIQKGGMNKETEAKVLSILHDEICQLSETSDRETSAGKAIALLAALEKGGFTITPKGK